MENSMWLAKTSGHAIFDSKEKAEKAIAKSLMTIEIAFSKDGSAYMDYGDECAGIAYFFNKKNPKENIDANYVHLKFQSKFENGMFPINQELDECNLEFNVAIKEVYLKCLDYFLQENYSKVLEIWNSYPFMPQYRLYPIPLNPQKFSFTY